MDYANGDTGSDRAYDYESERDGVEREDYLAFCEAELLEPDTDESVIAYRAYCDDIARADLMQDYYNKVVIY